MQNKKVIKCSAGVLDSIWQGRVVLWLAGCLHRQIHTRECIDVNDSVLARLVVNDDVDAEQ